MFRPSPLGNVLAAVGAVYFGYKSANKGKELGQIALIAIAAGAGGFILGNAVTSFFGNEYIPNKNF